jgi:hypothetical protein
LAISACEAITVSGFFRSCATIPANAVRSASRSRWVVMSWKTATATRRPVDLQRPAADRQQHAVGALGAAGHHLHLVAGLAVQRPYQGKLLNREQRDAVRPEDAVVLPRVGADLVVPDTHDRDGGRVVYQEVALGVDHPHAVADPVEQRDLALRLAFGGVRLGGGRDHARPGPAAGPSPPSRSIRSCACARLPARTSRAVSKAAATPTTTVITASTSPVRCAASRIRPVLSELGLRSSDLDCG